MTETSSLIEEKIAQALSFIETAERMIYAQKAVDISALEDHISALCVELNKLTAVEKQALADQLEVLFGAVERLENDINLQHDAITERLKFSDGRVNPLMAQEIGNDDNEDS